MFNNREYQRRATAQGIKTFLARELYRPARLPDVRPKRTAKPTGGPEQLRLDFSADRPLHDLFEDYD